VEESEVQMGDCSKQRDPQSRSVLYTGQKDYLGDNFTKSYESFYLVVDPEEKSGHSPPSSLAIDFPPLQQISERELLGNIKFPPNQCFIVKTCLLVLKKYLAVLTLAKFPKWLFLVIYTEISSIS